MMKALYHLILGLLIISVAHADASTSGEAQDALLKRLAKTLQETRAGEQSELGPLPSKEIANSLIHTQGMNYVTLQIGDPRSKGLYRITHGDVAMRDLKRQWFKLVKRDDEGREIWYRLIEEGGLKRPVFVARQRDGDLFYEVRAEYRTVKNGREDIDSRLSLLIANAAVNRLDNEEKRSIDTDKLKLFAGYWSGPMKNTLGGAAKSNLTVFVDDEGKIGGEWHAGWEIEDAAVQGREMTWKHNSVGGCRDYTNSLIISPEGNKGILKYDVINNCQGGKKYSGTSWLSQDTTKAQLK